VAATCVHVYGGYIAAYKLVTAFAKRDLPHISTLTNHSFRQNTAITLTLGSETLLIGPPSGPTMGGPINEVAAK